jgi:hypothetical protein
MTSRLCGRRAPLLAALLLCACGQDGGTNPPGGSTPNLIRACIRTAACSYLAQPRLGACTLNFVPNSPVEAARYLCIDQAKACADVATCLGAQGECDKTYQASCASGSAVYCDLIDKRVYTRRCGDFGQTCRVDSTYPFDAKCEGSGQAPKSINSGLDCGGDLCVETGQSCGITDSPNDRCAGEQLESCLRGQWVRFDCARLGLGTCRTTGDTPSTTWGHCTPPPS